METINYKGEHSYNDVIGQLKKLIYAGQKNATVLKISELANQIKKQYQKEKFIFDSVYNLAVYRASPEDRQQLRTVENIIRTKKANCTGYTTIVASILENLKIPYILRIVDLDGGGFGHIYLKTKDNVFDLILTQNQNGKENFKSRKPPLFNYEIDYKRKKDVPMITTLNDRLTKNRIRNRNVNGFYDTLFGYILGDECALGCNTKYMNDEVKRQECKTACSMGMNEYQFKQWKESGGTTIPLPNISTPSQKNGIGTQELLIGGGILLGAIYLFKKK